MLAEIICVTAFGFELSRALSGNTLSWAYVFEWPILGLYAVYMWRKILHEDFTPPPTASPPEAVDPRLTAYNDYLSRVHGTTNHRPTAKGED